MTASFLRSVFSSKKSQAISFFPPSWPSPLHHKCDQPGCWFPNPPQVAKGVYDCQGVPGGFYCEGTYEVSANMADIATRYFKEEFRIEEANKRRQRLMEKRRFEEDHYTHANTCHHDDHPKVKLAMNPNSRYESPVRRQRVASEAAPPPKSEKELYSSSRRNRVASEAAVQANAVPSLHRSHAQRRNPSQECAMPGVREYYKHHAPSKQPLPSSQSAYSSQTALAHGSQSTRHTLQTSRSAYPLRQGPSRVDNTMAPAKPPTPVPSQSRAIRSERDLHRKPQPHYSSQSRTAYKQHVHLQ